MNNFWDGYITPSVLYGCQGQLLPDVKRLTMYYAFCLAHFEREVEVMAELKKRDGYFSLPALNTEMWMIWLVSLCSCF